jgi:hypothetical protein
LDLLVVRYENRELALPQLERCEHCSRATEDLSTRQPSMRSVL